MKIVLEITLQTILAFFSILFYARIIGKKQIAELTFYDYINGITFGSVAANMASDINQRTWQHFVGLSLFAALTFLMQYISLKNRTAQKVIDGEPVVLIHQGKILEKNMAKTRFNLDDLLLELRQKNVFDIKDVDYGILEIDGKLSVLLNANKKPLTPEDLNLPGRTESIVSEVIMDGQVIEANLRQHGLSREWLNNKLKEHQINELNDVVFASYNPIDGSLYFDLRDDNLGKDTVDLSDVE